MKKSIELLTNSLRKAIIPFIGLIFAFVICGILLCVIHVNPIEAYIEMFKNALGSKYGISETLSVAIPMIIVAVGVTFAQKAWIFNIGAEGQVLMGALGAGIVGTHLNRFPTPLSIFIIIFAGFLFGAAWSLVPALLKALFSVNEVVINIMLNQIAIFLLSYLIREPLKDPSTPDEQSAAISLSAHFPVFVTDTKIHFGLIIALVLVSLLWFVLKKTSFGFRISVVGASLKTSKYVGISAAGTIFTVMLISGGIAGIAGANEVAAIQYRVVSGISSNYGYLGMTVAMISGGNPVMIIIAAILYAALQVGALSIQITQGVPMELAYVMQAVIVLFVLCSRQFAALLKTRLSKVPLIFKNAESKV